ncbi:MAG TPA: hypothetical protein VIA62_07695 [Thermoanaerobaculia bacterium]|jgi:hypothetical protein|nr:hypothetical protein [Thermoanaerobaculia bacterium]
MPKKLIHLGLLLALTAAALAAGVRPAEAGCTRSCHEVGQLICCDFCCTTPSGVVCSQPPCPT